MINPKSLTLHQLYGLFDPITHEWTDGVLGSTFREYAAGAAVGESKHFLICIQS